MSTTKKIVLLLGLLSLLSILLVACGGTTVAKGANQVHMNDTNFEQSSITIKKGESVLLVNDSASVHILENGYYDSNGNASPGSEPGAPHVDSTVNGDTTLSVGPFNTAGTFHIYCTVHPGMTLTVIVK